MGATKVIDYVNLSIDIFTFALSLGATFFAFLIRKKFEGGLLWKPWRIIGPAPLVYGSGELVHIAQQFTGPSTLLDFLHAVIEMWFILLLMTGFYLLYKAWTPKM